MIRKKFSIIYCLLFLFDNEQAFLQASQNYKGESLKHYLKDEINQIFKPISLDYLYQLYDDHKETHEQLSEYFQIDHVVNPQIRTNHKLVVYSLFWKRSNFNCEPPVVNQDNIHDVSLGKEGLSFYDYYVAPLLQNIKYFAEHEKHTVLRVYLANDLHFLIPELSSKNVEIYLMKTSSLAHSPGAMWRFLAFDDKKAKCICVKDSDDKIDKRKEAKINKWIHDEQTKGWYRFSSYKFRESLDSVKYSMIIADNFGAKGGLNLNIEKALKGFILHRQLFLNEARHIRDKCYDDHPYGFGNHFPVYGFDERFLKHVIYYHAANQGLLTTLVLNKEHIQDFKELTFTTKYYLVEKDYDYIFKRNPWPIYY